MVLSSGRSFWPVESGFNLLEAILSFSKRNMTIMDFETLQISHYKTKLSHSLRISQDREK